MIDSQTGYAKVLGEPILEIPTSLYIPPEALKIFLEQFQGPLDLLLYLIRKKNLDILEIDVLSITKQYIVYIDTMQQLEIDISAEYLLMASTLAEIKSRMLLPRPVGEDVEADVDLHKQLLNRLQEYEQVQYFSQQMDRLNRQDRDFLIASIPIDIEKIPYLECQLDQFAQIYQQIVKRQSNLSHYILIQDSVQFTIQTQTQWLQKLLGRQKKWQLSELVEAGIPDKLALVVTLLALLELEKDHQLTIMQNKPLEEVYIEAR